MLNLFQHLYQVVVIVQETKDIFFHRCKQGPVIYRLFLFHHGLYFF